MSMPKYDEFMLPLLQFVGDGKEHSSADIGKAMREHFSLTDGDMSLLLPSGTQTVFANRLAWAKVYLGQARLIESPKKGCIRITTRGKQVLASHPKLIDKKLLQQFEEFVAFLNRSKAIDKDSADKVADGQTPEEMLETSYQALRDKLGSELLESVQSCSPAFFERLVVDLLVKMGYGGSLKDAGNAIGGVGDGGVDGSIKEDRLGLDVIYVQAKKWQKVVGSPELQQFAGALQGKKAKKGIFITTSSFSHQAVDYTKHLDIKIALIDGEELASLMIDHNVGVNVAETYELKHVDSDYFSET